MKSEKWSVIRDSRVEVDCPMDTENTDNDKTHTDSAGTQSHRNDTTNRFQLSILLSVSLYNTRDPFCTCKCLTIRTSSVPAALPVHYRGPGLTLDLPLHFTPRCLPSTILGPRLNLGLCTASTGAQSSQLLTRLFPSTRRVVLPGRPEIPDEPPNVMHRARISEPTERANKSTSVMQRQEGNFLFLAR